MAGIKVGAHPMLVAVAMGLLGPSVLFDEDSQSDPASTRDPQTRSVSSDSMSLSLLPIDDEPPMAPSDEEFARVEHLWHEVRTLT